MFFDEKSQDVVSKFHDVFIFLMKDFNLLLLINRTNIIELKNSGIYFAILNTWIFLFDVLDYICQKFF